MSETNFYDVLLAKKLSGGSGKGGGITVKDAKVGQLIRAKKVDETGNITEYEPVPFMYEDVQETVTFPEQEVGGFVEANPGVYGLRPDPTNTKLINGNSYLVKWDGTDYPLTCALLDNALYIGNASIMGMGTDTGEPFLAVKLGDSVIWTTKSPATSHTIGVSTLSSTVYPIPSKYLEPYKVVFTIADTGAITADKSFEAILTWVESGFGFNAYISSNGKVEPLMYTNVSYDMQSQAAKTLEFLGFGPSSTNGPSRVMNAKIVVYNSNGTITHSKALFEPYLT